MIGVIPITRKTKQVYQVAFSYMGVQCREVIALEHSKANLAYCERRRANIITQIEKGEFNYAKEFPQSKRPAVFGHGLGKTALLKDLLEAYRDRVKLTFEPSTFAGTKTAIDNYLVPWCGHKQIGALRRADIREWVGLQTTSLKRIRNLLLPLRAVLAEAAADDVIPSNPLTDLDLSKLVPVEKRYSEFEPDPYSFAELRTLLGNLPAPERWHFQLWAFTGVRTGELIGLRWPRVDLEASTVFIKETTTAGKEKARPKTPAGVRTIPLLPAAREAIDALKPFTLLGGDRVCVNPRSTRDDLAWDDRRLAKIWRAAHKGTGIAYRTPYQLRHTFASQLLSQGRNPAYIAKLLGHKTIDMVTRVYGRWVSEGEKLGFDSPARSYGGQRLWIETCEVRVNSTTALGRVSDESPQALRPANTMQMLVGGEGFEPSSLCANSSRVFHVNPNRACEKRVNPKGDE